jgi:DNA-binding NtrC family response regulator
VLGQQAAKRLVLDLDPAAMEILFPDDNYVEFNVDIAPLKNGRLPGTTRTEVEATTDPTNSKTHKLEPDQTDIFNKVVRLVLQQNQQEETRPNLVVGPAGTGKTSLIFAILDATKSKGKEFIRTSFNAITATAIGGDTFSGDFSGVPNCT